MMPAADRRRRGAAGGAAVLALPALLLAACFESNVESGADVAGSYAAVLINGEPLPLRLDSTQWGVTHLTASTMTLRPDGTFTWEYSYEHVGGAGVQRWSESEDHRYTVVRGLVRLYMYGSTSYYVSATRAGRELSFTLNGLHWTLLRP
jgi:hypothetical protein